MALHPEVPGRFDVALGGRPYMVDLQQDTPDFRRQSIPILRDSQDSGATFGEGSLNPEELSRRTQGTWDHGAGQRFLDREDSDPARFRQSKGIDVWDRWELKLLPDTERIVVSGSQNLELLPSQGRLYFCDTNDLRYYTAVIGSVSTIGGLPPLGSQDTGPRLATDGFTIWVAAGNALYVTDRVSETATLLTSVATDNVGYVKGRLMTSQGPKLYNITAANLPTPAPFYTHPNTQWRWIGYAEGNSSIYIAGFSGDKSLIYRTEVQQDGVALDAPIIAAELPDGEVVTSIDSYLGFVLIGTEKGLRFCSANADGSLILGSRIDTPGSVLDFEGQDSYVWFTWTNYDDDSTGLGRLDLSTFTAPLVPAFASDLMAPRLSGSPVRSVTTFIGKRAFSVRGQGIYLQSDLLVSQGTLETGQIAYGISDPKVAMYVNLQTDNIASHGAQLSVDGGSFVVLGEHEGDGGEDSFAAGRVSGEMFEIRVVLNRFLFSTPTGPGGAAQFFSRGPVVSRITLRAYPTPRQGEIFTVPLLLHETVLTRGDSELRIDPVAELDLLLGLRRTRAIVAYQIGRESYDVIVDDTVFSYSHRTADGLGWNGTLVLKLKAIV